MKIVSRRTTLGGLLLVGGVSGQLYSNSTTTSRASSSSQLVANLLAASSSSSSSVLPSSSSSHSSGSLSSSSGSASISPSISSRPSSSSARPSSSKPIFDGVCTTGCGYSLADQILTYPGELNPVAEPYTKVTLTEVTFTYVDAYNSTSLSVGAFSNWNGNATTGDAFATPAPQLAEPRYWFAPGIAARLTAPTTYKAYTSAAVYYIGRPAISPFPGPSYTGCTNCLSSVTTKVSSPTAFPISDADADKAAIQDTFAKLEILGGQFSIDTCNAPVADLLTAPMCPAPPPTPPPPSGGHGTDSLQAPEETSSPAQTTYKPADSTTFMPVDYTTASVLTTSLNGPVIRAPPVDNKPPEEVAPTPPGPGIETVPNTPTVNGGTDGTGGTQGLKPGVDTGNTGTVTPTVNQNNVDPGFILGNEQVNPITGEQGGAVVNGNTIVPGGAITLANGVIASVANSGDVVVIGDQTAGLSNLGAGPTPVNLGGVVVTPAPNGNGVVVNGQTIPAGGVATLAGGENLSVLPGGVVIVGSETAVVGGFNVNGPASPVTFGGNNVMVTPLAAGGIAISGLTLTPGAQTILPNGESISVGSSGVVVLNGNTAVITPPPGAASTPPPVTIDGVVATPILGGAVIISGSTLLPGQTIVFANGQTVGLASGGTAVVVNGQTATINTVNGRPSVIPVVFNGETITPMSSGTILIAGQILTPGQILTLSDGHKISVGTSGTVVVDGTTTHLPSINPQISTTGTGSLTTISRNSTTTSSTKTSSSTTSDRSVGGAIASGIGVTKKGDADALYLGRQEGMAKVGFGLILGLVGFVAGL